MTDISETEQEQNSLEKNKQEYPTYTDYKKAEKATEAELSKLKKYSERYSKLNNEDDRTKKEYEKFFRKNNYITENEQNIPKKLEEEIEKLEKKLKKLKGDKFSFRKTRNSIIAKEKQDAVDDVKEFISLRIKKEKLDSFNDSLNLKEVDVENNEYLKEIFPNGTEKKLSTAAIKIAEQINKLEQNKLGFLEKISNSFSNWRNGTNNIERIANLKEKFEIEQKKQEDIVNEVTKINEAIKKHRETMINKASESTYYRDRVMQDSKLTGEIRNFITHPENSPFRVEGVTSVKNRSLRIAKKALLGTANEVEKIVSRYSSSPIKRDNITPNNIKRTNGHSINL